MTEWTPGPWEAFVEDGGRLCAVVGPRGGEVVLWTGFDGATESGAKSPAKRAANARLIAAAPDRAEALLSAKNVIDQLRNASAVETDLLLEAEHLTDAALSKARGEPQ